MSFFTNKHIIVALIVAPILAIIAWFATGILVNEKPHRIKNGGVYTLNVKSNCRWASGKCTLENVDVKIDITGNYTNKTLNLEIKSSVVLSGVKIAFNNHDKPQSFIYDEKNKLWRGVLDLKYKSNLINAVFIIDDTIFYAQFPTTFLEK